MAKTFAEAFRGFQSKLEISALQASRVSTRHQNIRDHLVESINLLDSFLTGSYRRSTLITPLKEADIDVFVVLHPDYYKLDGQAALLDRVRRVLLQKYKTPRVSRNGQAVTIFFEDFRVDVVPGFYREGGGYLIPDAPGSRWIGTDPKKHVEICTAENKSHGGDLVPALKMFKAWNRVHSSHLRSFHLERLFTNAFSGYNIQVWGAAIPYAFGQVETGVILSVSDPAGYTGDVGDYLKFPARLAVSRAAKLAKEQALRARLANVAGKPAVAIGEYRKIFNGYFPAYD